MADQGCIPNMANTIMQRLFFNPDGYRIEAVINGAV